MRTLLLSAGFARSALCALRLPPCAWRAPLCSQSRICIVMASHLNRLQPYRRRLRLGTVCRTLAAGFFGACAGLGGDAEYPPSGAELFQPGRDGHRWGASPFDCLTGCLRSTIAAVPRSFGVVLGRLWCSDLVVLDLVVHSSVLSSPLRCARAQASCRGGCLPFSYHSASLEHSFSCTV